MDIHHEPKNDADSLKKRIRHVFWLYFVMFACFSAYLIKFVASDSRYIVEHTSNPRPRNFTDDDIRRGDIVDANGEILAVSVKDSEKYNREYPFGETFAHIVGFDTFGRSGAESRYNLTLQTLDGEIMQRVNGVFSGAPLQGLGIALTVDAGLQEMAFNGLSGYRGAAVVMEPSTGKILAMASAPSFDPNEISSSWDSLVTDDERSPLLNRAAQGLYPPGSIFKIVTSAAAFEFDPNIESFSYNCEGSAVFGAKRIRCFNSTAHGDVDIARAMAVSCNTFYSTIGVNIGAENMRAVAERLLFNAYYPAPFPLSRSSFALDADSEISEIVETSIGQGKTLITPLHAAVITSAVANGGVMMEPYIVDHAFTKNGKIKDKRLPTAMARAFTLEETAFLTDIMIGVVENGSGKGAAIDGVRIAAKTGTAENSSGGDHGWFTAFAPAEKPCVVVTVIMENAENTARAQALARDIIQYSLNNFDN
ncbi:MAG: penicillin-binding protein 2 [Clostridiales bacterium]|jgi:peptidoglycan glycosyltransferase|nr:penicillin-binding protein 2 [Clostridiales bacterium]